MIRFSLDSRFEGPSAPFLWALEKGYYQAEGLEVTIDAGKDSTEAINRVASGSHDMALADINALIRFRDKKENPPLKAVAVIHDAAPFAIVSLSKSGILKPKDLEGKILGAPATDEAFALWKAFATINKIDVSKVRIENIGMPVREAMLTEGKVQAILGPSYSLYVNLRSRGISQEAVKLMLMHEHGLALYGGVIVVNPTFAQKHPKAVAGFVRATLRAVKEVAQQQRDGVKLVIKRNPIADEQWESIRLKLAYDQNLFTKEVLRRGLGGVDMKRLSQAIDQIGLAFDFTNKPKAEDIFDPQFLPPKAERSVVR